MSFNKEKNTLNVLASLRNMSVGEKLAFPAERASYVRSACVTFGFEWNKKFSTRNNRENRTVEITRVQ